MIAILIHAQKSNDALLLVGAAADELRTPCH
jgi:hypothetical protein